MTAKFPTPDSIRKYAEKAFIRYIKAWVRGESEDFFPLTVPKSAVRMNDYGNISQIQHAVHDLITHAKPPSNHGHKSSGFTVVMDRRRARDGGTNNEIEKIRIDSELDLVSLANQRTQFEHFKLAVDRLRSHLPELSDWILRRPQRLLNSIEILDGLIEVVDCLKRNPRPGVFARELPLTVDTKFIERHQAILHEWLNECSRDLRVFGEENFFAKYGMRKDGEHHSIHILDPDLQVEYSIPFKELSLSADDLKESSFKNVNVLFVENRVNLLTLPPLKRTIGVEGKGSFVNQYASMPWLHNCTLHYWGDLDVEGFGILATFRSAIRDHGLNAPLPSVMMDQATFDRFSEYSVEYSPSKITGKLAFLTESERAVFDMLVSNKLRLEQEQISQAYIRERLQALIAANGFRIDS